MRHDRNDRHQGQQDRFESRQGRGSQSQQGRRSSSMNEDRYQSQGQDWNRNEGDSMDYPTSRSDHYDQWAQQPRLNGQGYQGDRGSYSSQQNQQRRDPNFGSQYGQQYGQHFGASQPDYGYGSTEESRNFRNMSEDRYQGAMDFGSHTFNPRQTYSSNQDTTYGSYGSAGSNSSESSRREQGRFSGRGPKGYKRSDDRLKEDVSEMIMRHDEIDGSDIEVEVASGEVTLTGSVPDRQMKHRVETLIEGSLGVSEIHNQLRVKKADSNWSSSSERSSDSKDADAAATKGAAGKKSATPNPSH